MLHKNIDQTSLSLNDIQKIIQSAKKSHKSMQTHNRLRSNPECDDLWIFAIIFILCKTMISKVNDAEKN